VANLAEIAAIGGRLRSLIVGYADLGASLGVDPGARPEVWLPVQQALIVHARANGLDAVDGPYLGTADDESFRSGVNAAAAMGFDCKWVIHPRQIATVNGTF